MWYCRAKYDFCFGWNGKHWAYTVATTFAVFALRAFEQARLWISYTNLTLK